MASKNAEFSSAGFDLDAVPDGGEDVLEVGGGAVSPAKKKTVSKEKPKTTIPPAKTMPTLSPDPVPISNTPQRIDAPTNTPQRIDAPIKKEKALDYGKWDAVVAEVSDDEPNPDDEWVEAPLPASERNLTKEQVNQRIKDKRAQEKRVFEREKRRKEKLQRQLKKDEAEAKAKKKAKEKKEREQADLKKKMLRDKDERARNDPKEYVMQSVVKSNLKEQFGMKDEKFKPKEKSAAAKFLELTKYGGKFVDNVAKTTLFWSQDRHEIVLNVLFDPVKYPTKYISVTVRDGIFKIATTKINENVPWVMVVGALSHGILANEMTVRVSRDNIHDNIDWSIEDPEDLGVPLTDMKHRRCKVVRATILKDPEVEPIWWTRPFVHFSEIDTTNFGEKNVILDKKLVALIKDGGKYTDPETNCETFWRQDRNEVVMSVAFNPDVIKSKDITLKTTGVQVYKDQVEAAEGTIRVTAKNVEGDKVTLLKGTFPHTVRMPMDEEEIDWGIESCAALGLSPDEVGENTKCLQVTLLKLHVGLWWDKPLEEVAGVVGAVIDVEHKNKKEKVEDEKGPQKGPRSPPRVDDAAARKQRQKDLEKLGDYDHFMKFMEATQGKDANDPSIYPKGGGL